MAFVIISYQFVRSGMDIYSENNEVDDIFSGDILHILYRTDKEFISCFSEIIRSRSNSKRRSIILTSCQEEEAFIRSRLCLSELKQCSGTDTSDKLFFIPVENDFYNDPDQITALIGGICKMDHPRGLDIYVNLTGYRSEKPLLMSRLDSFLSSLIDQGRFCFNHPTLSAFYLLDSFTAPEIFELMDIRQKVIVKHGVKWTVLKDMLSSQYRKHLRSSPESMRKTHELKRIYRNSPAVAFVWGLSSGRPIQFVSENISQFGYNPEELVAEQKAYVDLIHPDDRRLYLEKLNAFINDDVKDQGFFLEYRILDHMNEVRWVSETSFLENGSGKGHSVQKEIKERDFSNEKMHFQGIILDVTRQKLAEEAMHRSEMKFKMLFDNSNDAIYMEDVSGNFLEVNQLACDRLGYSRDEFLSLNAKQIYAPLDAVGFESRLEEVIKKGHSIFEVNHLRKDGTVIPVEMSIRLLEYEAKPVMFSICRDITERKRVEHVLIEAREKAEDASRSKSEFLANMSHELRTPLNAIIGFSDMLLFSTTGPLSGKQKKYVCNVSKSGKHLLSLINDILDLSKVEAGKAVLDHSDFSISSLLQEIRSTLSPLAMQKDISFSLISPDPGLVLHADRKKISQVLYNLLGNAIKFTPAGGTVILDLEIQDHILLFKVQDTGIGISKEDQNKLFDHFVQLDSAANRKYEGTGLGLALSRRFVEMHGGSIQVESETGKGSTFTFTIPLKNIERSPVVMEIQSA